MQINVTENEIEQIKNLLIQGKTPKKVAQIMHLKNMKWIIILNGLEGYVRNKSSLRKRDLEKYVDSGLSIREIADKERVNKLLVYSTLNRYPALKKKLLGQNQTGKKIQEVKDFIRRNPKSTNKDICVHFGFSRQYLSSLQRTNKV